MNSQESRNGMTARGTDTVRRKVQRYSQYVCYIAILLIATLAFPGAIEIDGQVFAVNMGFDRLDNGMLRLTLQMPAGEENGGSSDDSSGGSSGGSGGGSGDPAEEGMAEKKRQESRQNGYIIASTDGVNYSDAMNIMVATLPKIVNVSHVKQVIFSEKLASEDDFVTLFTKLVYNVEFFNSAQVVVCTGEASELIKEQKLLMGARLSKAQDIANYTHQAVGFTQDAPVADMYFNLNSHYGSPIAMLAAVNDFTSKASSTPDRSGDIYAGEAARVGANANDYFGTALFDSRHMVGKLTGYETQLMQLVCGTISSMLVMDDSNVTTITMKHRPHVTVITGEQAEVYVELFLNTQIKPLALNADIVAGRLQGDITELIDKCRALNVDPFMFGQYAAHNFATYDDFEDYDWYEKFRNAVVGVTVNVEAIHG